MNKLDKVAKTYTNPKDYKAATRQLVRAMRLHGKKYGTLGVEIAFELYNEVADKRLTKILERYSKQTTTNSDSSKTET